MLPNRGRRVVWVPVGLSLILTVIKLFIYSKYRDAGVVPYQLSPCWWVESLATIIKHLAAGVHVLL